MAFDVFEFATELSKRRIWTGMKFSVYNRSTVPLMLTNAALRRHL